MNTRTTSKSALFLMELILAIFFFSLASAVCIQLFVKAHILGNDTTNKSRSVMWAQNIAESYLGNDGDLNATAVTLDATLDSPNSFSLYFDKDWNCVSESQSVYAASVEVTADARLNTAYITILRNPMDDVTANSGSKTNHFSTDSTPSNDSIYELNVSLHIPMHARDVASSAISEMEN
ncbi:MAG: hypothetical protein PHE02_08925 [Lachnospiraceae bacterium]|nr:hypothetical protein [Lachnospiraceae bacterium]